MNDEKITSPLGPAATSASAPERKHVHASYIWLGTLRSVGAVLVVLVVGGISSISSLIRAASYEYQLFGSQAFGYGSVFMTIILALVVVLVVVALVVGIHAWAWRHLWYELGPEEVSVYSGIISKKRVHVPYDRIQTVDQKASLLQRAFGVCNVTIDTAGGASNKAVLIPYLRKGDADALRHELYARKMGMSAATTSARATVDAAPPTGAPIVAAPAPAGATTRQGNVLDLGEEAWQQFGGVFAGDTFDMGAPSFEYRLTNKELVFTGLSNNGGFILTLIAILAGVSSIVSFAFDLFPNESNAIMTDAASRFDPFFLVLIGGIVLIACTIVGWCISVLGTCVQYGGFHARRRGTRVEVERGLLKHQTESLDLARVQSVIIKQSFIRRLIGYCELSLGKVDAAESENSNENTGITPQGLIVHPFLKVDRVHEVLAGLVPEFADIPDATTRVAPVALRRGLIRRCLWQGNGFWVAVSVAALQIVAHLIAAFDPEVVGAIPSIDLICAIMYGFAAVFFVLDIIGSVFWYRESAFATNKRFARIKNGGLSSMDVSVPRQKIQFGNTKTNPFQRMAKTATIQMRTAAGVSGTTTQLIDVSQDNAASWLEWITPKTSRPAR